MQFVTGKTLKPDEINHEPDRFCRLPEVRHLTGLSRASIYALGARGEFPRQYLIGVRTAAWSEREIQGWIAGRKTRG